jgi:hypothetical protein
MVAWLLRSLLKMRLNATRLGSIASSRSFGDQLDDLAGQVPSLDLNFAQNKSLIDDYSGTTPVTHTRASSGTYVDSDGVLRSAVTNLFTHSESISSGWGISNTSITSDAIASPVGTITADLATNTGGNDSISRVATVGSSATVAFSLYMKRSNIDWVRLTFLNGANEVQAWFNLSTGTIGTVNATGTATSASASIQNIGNGWYRCVLVGAIPGQTSYTFFNTTAAADASFTRVTGGERYLWGAQLEQSTTVGEYVPTTSTINSAPRFDHNPTTGESLGLLVEEQRTNLLLYSACNSNWPTGGFGTPTYNLDLSALGVFSGVQVASLGQNWHSIYRTGISLTASTVYAFTLFYRAGTSGRVRLVFRNNTTTTETIVNGVAGNLSVSAASAGAATILSQYLCSDGLTYVVTGTFTPNNTSADHWYRIGPDSTTSGQTVIALGGQLEAGAFPTSYIPTTTATVTRAADVASITGSNFGVTRTNLLVRSEEFDNASWGVKTNLSVSANAVTAPNGTLTADKLVENSANAEHFIPQTVYGLNLANVHAFSVYLKSAERSHARVRLGASGNFVDVVINLSTGGLDTPATGGTGSAPIANATSVGDGWFRVSISGTNLGISGQLVANVTIHNGTTTSYQGDGTSGIYIWGAQLEVGSAVTPYIQSPSVFTSRASSGTYVGGNGLIQTATTNEARYDHDPISLISKGLLLEEARTNLLLRSEEFDNAGWTTSAGTVSANSIASPAGAITADTFVENTSNALHRISRGGAVVSGLTYTTSVYAKYAGRFLYFNCNAIHAARATFDLQSGTVATVAAGSAAIVAMGNGWYRCSITGVAAATLTQSFFLQLNDTSVATDRTYTGDGTSGIYLWGAQLEAGAFATSYIPTTTATVTRAADISTSVATSVFESSWYRQDEGTVFVDANGLGSNVPSADFQALASFSDGTNDTRIELGYMTSSIASWLLRVSGSTSVNLLPSISSIRRKLAGSFDSSIAEISANGSTVLTDSSVIIPTVNKLDIGGSNAATIKDFHGTISRLTYWPTRLGNEVLQRITQ